MLWRDAGTLILLVAPRPEVVEEGLDLFAELLDWEFAVYSVDASQRTIHQIQSFRGLYPSAILAPDLSRLGYVRAVRESEARELYIADLAEGTEVLYAAGNEPRLIGWGPDSNRFLFAIIVDDQWKVNLGEVGQEARPLDIRPDGFAWLDDDHFVAKPVLTDLELHLYSVQGEVTLIAAVRP